MKKLLFVLMLLPFAANAQTYTTGATASSNAGAASQSGSVAISGGGGGGAGGAAVGASNFTVNPSVAINSTGSDLSQAVPLVTAPQMTVLGGEDSCLKSRSGGGAFSGFGASFGTMVMDNECNRRVLSKQLMAYNQVDLAVAVLCGSPQMWAAAERVAARRKITSVCHNEQPDSADVISTSLRAEEVAAGPVDTADDYKWSYPKRDDQDDFLY